MLNEESIVVARKGLKVIPPYIKLERSSMVGGSLELELSQRAGTKKENDTTYEITATHPNSRKIYVWCKDFTILIGPSIFVK